MTSKGFSEKYDKWNSITNELVTQTEKEEEEEAKVGAEFLGLNGKVPRSAAEAEEKAKLEAEESELQSCWQEKQNDFHTLQSKHEQECERNTKALEQVC